MGRESKATKELRRNRAKWDFQFQVILLINQFKSTSEPEIELSYDEITHALSEIVTKRLNK